MVNLTLTLSSDMALRNTPTLANQSPGVNNNNLLNNNLATNSQASLGSPYAVLETVPRNEVIPTRVDGVTMSTFIESKAARTQEVVLSPIDHDYIFGSWEPGMTVKFDISNNNKAENSLLNCNCLSNGKSAQFYALNTS